MYNYALFRNEKERPSDNSGLNLMSDRNVKVVAKRIS
jgi:hypothetical protein